MLKVLLNKFLYNVNNLGYKVDRIGSEQNSVRGKKIESTVVFSRLQNSQNLTKNDIK